MNCGSGSGFVGAAIFGGFLRCASGAMVQRTFSIVFKTALTSVVEASVSLSQVGQSSSFEDRRHTFGGKAEFVSTVSERA
jgi:hypothetical protein